ncbi:MAG: histidinol-phosphate transaminase [Desulfovibrionaceae bacterium]|nr:histidinol-phosphate transaminase [Desulfovibrionaceae bacterium]MBF0514234.1 histidinol-phosphate transaminase [Desulfovibrionaceae bacterium]
MPVRRTVRDEVLEFTPYAPGLSIDEIRRKYGLTNVIKMASNENPLGAPPLAQKAIQAAAALAFRYPQAGNPRLIRALSQAHGVAENRLAAGNGSDEIIDLILRIKARPGRDNIVAFTPCFSIYALQARLCGLTLRRAPLAPGFSFDLDALVAACDENTAVVFLTNPDNPSGYAIKAGEVLALARKLPRHALLVVDEAYIEFAEPYEEYSVLTRLAEADNLAVLRTFSKLYGLAGLRLGFSAMPAWLADYVARVKLPFSVNLLAEEAGIAALEDAPFKEKTLETVRAGRALLTRELAAMGFAVFPSQANFVMFKPSVDAGELFSRLLARGIIIRPLKSYGLPEYLRVSVGSPEENAAFLTAVRELARELG